MLLVVAALALTYPFFSPLTIGGTDAKWYAFMLSDFLEQMRRGHFPALVGQGPLAWNGGIHPFRSAPIYMLVGGAWNALTFGRMTALTIQHLTVVTSAVVGVLGFYTAATALAPRHRWEAWLAALVYLGTPIWVVLIVCADAYMSYMAFAVFPLVLYGNARTVLDRGRRGYPALAAGLALLWMAHPPIAALTTMVTLLIQVGSLLADRTFAWRQAAFGAVWFGALGAYYFYGISELPPVAGTGGAARDLIQVIGLALALSGVAGFGMMRRGPGWAAAAAIGLLILGAMSWPWLVWVGVTALLAIGVTAAGRLRGWFDPERRVFEILYACGLVAAALANVLLPGHPGERNEAALGLVAVNTSQFLDYLRPLSRELLGAGISQLGWSVSLAGLAVWITFFGSRPLVVKLLGAGALTVLISFFRLPGVSDFLVGTFPISLAGLWSNALSLRLVPVIASFAIMAGFLWIGLGPAQRPLRRRLVVGVAVAAAAWTGLQGSVFVHWSIHQTGDPKHSVDNFRPENVVLDRFAYDLLKLPAYYSNGVMDPRLESRLHDATGRVVVGPAETVRAMESAESTRTRLRVHPIPGSSVWLWVKPGFTLNPGEHRVLRFEFNPKENYAGYLFLVSEHGYREYHLPDSGMGGDSAFGVGPNHTTVLSMWNSGTVPENYILSFSREPGNTFTQEGTWFADLILSRFDPARAPVRLDSLLPYRATVAAAGPGELETIRAYLPGYRATVDGREVPVARSSESIAQVAVPAGTHVVELRYTGTGKLHLAAAISGLAWIALGWLGLQSWTRGRAERRGPSGGGRAGGVRPRGVASWSVLSAVALAGLFLGESALFHRLSLRPTDWIYPRWNDQIQYLTEAYTGYEFTLWHGLLSGLWQTLLKPSAQGVLYDTFAVLGFWFVGPSRGAALALNLVAWIALQAAFYGVTVRRLGSRSLAWAGVALLLCWATPLSAWAGSAIDFRLDFMAACAFGLALAAVINTEGFHCTGRSLLAGIAIGFALLLRFLTGTYFVLLLVGLLAWVLAGSGRRRRVGNLLAATFVAAAMTLPEFWKNREWVWNYYVIGHFTGPESAIRSPHLGVGPSLEFVVGGLLRDHLGWSFGVAALVLTVAYAAIGGWAGRRGRSDKAVHPMIGSWMIPSALFTLVPLLVLTLHNQKSSIVLSILVPGVVALLLGAWAWLAGFSRTAGAPVRSNRWRAVAAGGAMLWAAAHFIAAQTAAAPGAALAGDARTVNRLADTIFAASARAGLASPRVGVDRVTDALDGQVLRVICYERHRVWVPFSMMLPTGIAREREAVILDHLAQSDFMFLDESADSTGGFPFDQEMRELRPQTEAWCRERLRFVERFTLAGRTWALYARPELIPAGKGG
jgi:hypothetical protein